MYGEFHLQFELPGARVFRLFAGQIEIEGLVKPKCPKVVVHHIEAKQRESLCGRPLHQRRDQGVGCSGTAFRWNRRRPANPRAPASEDF